jgi:hypothetical protein
LEWSIRGELSAVPGAEEVTEGRAEFDIVRSVEDDSSLDFPVGGVVLVSLPPLSTGTVCNSHLAPLSRRLPYRSWDSISDVNGFWGRGKE